MKLLRKTSTLIAGCLLSVALCAQPDSSRIVVPVAKATLLAPGFSFEVPTGRQQTLLLHAFASPSFSLFWGAGSGLDASFTLSPSMSAEYRFYYNYARRRQQGRRTDLNSLNYLAPVAMVNFSKNAMADDHLTEEKLRGIYTAAFVWGFQRNYKGRFSLDLGLGPAVSFGRALVPGASGNVQRTNHTSVWLLTNLTLGIWLNKR